MSKFYLLILLLYAGQAQAQKAVIDSAVNRAARSYMDTAGTKGLSIGIYDKGRNYIYHYGEPAIADQYYNLGSVAKTFVTTMLAEAVIEHKARLDDDIRKYLPGKYPNLQYAGHPVTLKQLANHTSGLPGSFRQMPDSLKKLSIPQQIAVLNRYTADTLMKDLHRVQLTTRPGIVYHYNGQAMMVLILLLERIYHQPFDQLVTHYLRIHLHMQHSSPVLTAQEIRQFVQGYGDDHQPKTYVNFTGFYGGPSMNSTLNDMMLYLKANLTEKDPAIKLTHQVTFRESDGTAIGLGWHHDKDDKGTPVIYHSGHTGIGFNTLCLFYPGKDLGYIIMVNEVLDQQRLTDLQKHIQVQLDQR